MNILFIGDLKTTTTLFVTILWIIGAFIPMIVAYGVANKELSVGGELPRGLKNQWSKTGWFWAIAIAGVVFLIAKAYINAESEISSEGVFHFGKDPIFWLCLLVIFLNGILNLVIAIKWVKDARTREDNKLT